MKGGGIMASTIGPEGRGRSRGQLMETWEPESGAGAGIPAPEPLPLPTPVTSAGSALGPGGGGRSWIVAIVAAVAVFAVLGAAAFGYLLFTLATASVRDRVVAPAALRQRAAREYPDATIAHVDSLLSTGTLEARGRSLVVYFTMADRRHTGFRYTIVYSAPTKVATDPLAFENLDTFFRPSVDTTQPTDSFMAMWMGSHPTDTCAYVAELGESGDATRTYEVGLTHPAKGVEGVGLRKVFLAYRVATDTWTESVDEPAAGAEPAPVPTVTLAPEPEPAPEPPVVEESFPGTATAVARALPGFEVVGVAQMADATWVSVVRNKRYRSVRLITEPEYLEPGDMTDGSIALFTGPTTRATAFLKMWSREHPGTIMESIWFDPDSTGDQGLLEVTYSPGPLKDVDVIDLLKTVRFRYKAKARAWVRQP